MTLDSTSFGVRRAKPADIAALMDFVPLILAETTFLPLSEAKIQALVERCAHSIGGAAIAGIIDGDDGPIDASIGLAFCDSDTSDESYIAAVWCGIHPNVRKMPPKPDDPRAHYARKLFEFARWCHELLEAQAQRPVLIRFDVLTRDFLAPKMAWYQRFAPQVGASFAFGAMGTFTEQRTIKVPQEAVAELVAA